MRKSKRRKYGGYASFVMVPRKMLRSEEWKCLSPAAKIFYIHLKGKYNGQNNGDIRLHYSELKDIKGLASDSTISRAIQELENNHWITRTRHGGLHRHANKFELTGKYDPYL